MAKAGDAYELELAVIANPVAGAAAGREVLALARR